MEEQKKHWTNKVQVFDNVEIGNVEKTLNNFYKDRFVIATQIFPPNLTTISGWVMIVYYKTPPEEKAE